MLLLVAATLLACGLAGQSLALTTLLFMFCFAALGAGNGALFQLVPLRWPLATAVAGSMIGEVGALGGGFLPNAMGQSKQLAGTYLWGFVSFALLALAMLLMLRVLQIRWTRTWAERVAEPSARPTRSALRARGRTAPRPRARTYGSPEPPPSGGSSMSDATPFDASGCRLTKRLPPAVSRPAGRLVILTGASSRRGLGGASVSRNAALVAVAATR